MAPSPPTAQPFFLSAVNFTLLIAFPCGRGFCHCQGGASSTCPFKFAAASVSVRRTSAQVTNRRLARHRKWLENVAEGKDNLVRLRGKMSSCNYRGVESLEVEIIKVNCWESEVDVNPGSNASRLHYFVNHMRVLILRRVDATAGRCSILRRIFVSEPKPNCGIDRKPANAPARACGVG